MRQHGTIPLGMILYGVAAIAIVGVLFWIRHVGVEAGRAEVQAKWDRAVREQRAKEEKQAAAAATKLEVANAKARVVTRTVTVEVEKVVERPIYRNVCLDADGLRIAQCAIRGESPAACQPDQPLRPPAPADGRDRGSGAALDHGRGGPLPGMRPET